MNQIISVGDLFPCILLTVEYKGEKLIDVIELDISTGKCLRHNGWGSTPKEEYLDVQYLSVYLIKAEK